MKLWIARWTSLAFALALTASLAEAQGALDNTGSNRKISFGIGGGVAVPVSDAKDAFKNGFAGQGFVRLNLGMLPIAPRVDFTFSQFDLESAAIANPTQGPTTTTTGTGTILAGLASLQYGLSLGPIRPYLIAGVGAYNVKTETDDAGAYTGTSNSDTRFGINGGGGVTFKLGSMVSGFIEGRVDNVFTEKGAIDTDQIQIVPVTFGLVF